MKAKAHVKTQTGPFVSAGLPYVALTIKPSFHNRTNKKTK